MNNRPGSLGPRERQIVELLLEGCVNAEIARELKMAPRNGEGASIGYTFVLELRWNQTRQTLDSDVPETDTSDEWCGNRVHRETTERRVKNFLGAP
jgi:FixJ family two-component response regulator